jgi:hypothetical protein
MTDIDAGRLVFNVLKAEGVRRIFAMPGGHAPGIGADRLAARNASCAPRKKLAAPGLSGK